MIEIENKNQIAERIVRVDMDIRSRERSLTGDMVTDRFARRELGRLRTQRNTWADAMYREYGFNRATEMIRVVRVELDSEYGR